MHEFFKKAFDTVLRRFLLPFFCGWDILEESRKKTKDGDKYGNRYGGKNHV